MAKVVGYNERLKYRVSCSECSAIVEYVKNELFTNGLRDEGALITWLTCPGCGTYIRID